MGKLGGKGHRIGSDSEHRRQEKSFGKSEVELCFKKESGTNWAERMDHLSWSGQR